MSANSAAERAALALAAPSGYGSALRINRPGQMFAISALGREGW